MNSFDKRLTKYMKTFYGYGSYKARCWFIGMEEGGGATFEEIRKRLCVWEQRGSNELEKNIAKFHELIDELRWFGDNPIIQPTWNKLIHIIMNLNGRPCGREDVRTYQQQKLARNNECCLLELFPLPSPSTDQWLYNKFSSIPDLKSRKKYEEKLAPSRIKHLQKKIKKYRPRVVVFYGLGHMKYWIEIVHDTFKEKQVEGTRFCLNRNKNTVFAVVAHPRSRGNSYFDKIGKKIKSLL